MGSKNKLATVDAWQQEGVMLGGLSRRVAHPSTFWTSGPPRTAAHQLSTLSTKCLKYVPWMQFIHKSSSPVPMYECATHLTVLQWKRMTTKQKGVQKSGLLRSQRYWRLCPKMSGHATRAPVIFFHQSSPTHRLWIHSQMILTRNKNHDLSVHRFGGMLIAELALWPPLAFLPLLLPSCHKYVDTTFGGTLLFLPRSV